MEQGPEEISDRPDERAEELREATERPLDERGGDGEDAEARARDEDLQRIDPGL